MSALTGVGPAIASGSHVYNGICALLPIAPMNSNNVIATITLSFVMNEEDAEKTLSKSEEPKVMNMRNTPRINPRSPMRFIIKALFAAAEYSLFFHQKPISKYE